MLKYSFCFEIWILHKSHICSICAKSDDQTSYHVMNRCHVYFNIHVSAAKPLLLFRTFLKTIYLHKVLFMLWTWWLPVNRFNDWTFLVSRNLIMAYINYVKHIFVIVWMQIVTSKSWTCFTCNHTGPIILIMLLAHVANIFIQSVTDEFEYLCWLCI